MKCIAENGIFCESNLKLSVNVLVNEANPISKMVVKGFRT